jgi:hypothetical protein
MGQNRPDTGAIHVFFEWSEQRVWSHGSLCNLLERHAPEWGLGAKPRKALNQLLRLGLPIREVDFPELRPPCKRFCWGEPSALEVAMSLHPAGYLAYESAMYLHGMMRSEPTTVYLNIEQDKEGSSSGLAQERIDEVFQRPPRLTNARAKYLNCELRVPNPKKTGNYRVITANHPRHGELRLTDLERTLIDIVVRPEYGGGSAQIADAYQAAAPRVLLPELITALDELAFAYPYHQAVGFHLHRTDHFTLEDLEPLRSMNMGFKFYLERQIEEPTFNETWQIWYPRALDR